MVSLMTTILDVGLAAPSSRFRSLAAVALLWLLLLPGAKEEGSWHVSGEPVSGLGSIFSSLLGGSGSQTTTTAAATAQAPTATQANSDDANFAAHQQAQLQLQLQQQLQAEQLHQIYKNGHTFDKVTLPGDILLGGLFPIHMKGAKVECGAINRDRGIQRLEAMLYALDRINEDSKLLPDIKLGAILLDSCSSSTYALNQSLEFIRASINTVESSAFECKDKSAPRPKYGSKMIAGVIGGSYSEVSLQVANLLRLFRIPQVSYASTGTALSDKSLYDLFARTVPSDMFQARAIADIVLKLKWAYVSLVSSEGLYGDSGSKEFTKQASMRKICIATHEKISPTMDGYAYDSIINKLREKNATGVVLFTRAEDTRELLLAVKRAKMSKELSREPSSTNFAWVAADGWGTHQKLVEGVEEVAWGAITVELQAKAIPGFDQYMKAMTPWANARNPWFSEYWQEWFDCQLQANLVQQQQVASGAYARRSLPAWQPTKGQTTSASAQDPYGGPTAASDEEDYALSADSASANRRRRQTAPGNGSASGASARYKRAIQEGNEVKQFCSPNLRISESNGYRQEQKVQFVVDAVYAMAHALHKAWFNLCDGQPGLVCEALKELKGGDFYAKYLLNVSFEDLAGSEVKFDERGDGLGRYNIYNYRQVRRAAIAQAGSDSLNDLSGGDSPSGASEQLGSSGNASFRAQGTAQATAIYDNGAGLFSSGSGNDGDIKQQLAATEQSGNQADFANSQQLLERAELINIENVVTSNAEFEYSTIGRWTENDYYLQTDDIQFVQGEKNIPESYCSLPCDIGQAKITRLGDTCCWMCKTCAPYEYLPNENVCEDCGVGRWPHQNKTSCFDLPQKYLRWDSIYSLISLSIACLGIALTIFVTVTFIKYIDTPVVKASGRELSFILLAGIAFCHLSTFVLLSKPTPFICGSQRFLVNFGFSLMYASLLVKTNRISRIFNCARKSAKRPSFISPRSQMLITGILVAIQIFLTIVWFIFEAPGIRAESPEGKRDEVILKCRAKGKSFIISLVYNMILITTCTVYAVKTRKIPENFNESKFIGFTMYTTIVIWLAFVTMFFGTNNSYEIQINTMCVCISLSAYVTLFCLFSPKLSIILLHPDKNVRKLTMNSAQYKRPFQPTSSAGVHNGGRSQAGTGGYYGGALTDAGSGGPMSTTSNVLNLAESQTARMQESSIVSNVVNSNSASNCSNSQKTPTTLSQQLTLIGSCANCGAQQLSQVPAHAFVNESISERARMGSLQAQGAAAASQRAVVAGSGGFVAQRTAGSGQPEAAGKRQQLASASVALSSTDRRPSRGRSSSILISGKGVGAKSAKAKVLHNTIQGAAGKNHVEMVKRMSSDDHLLARNQRQQQQAAHSNLTKTKTSGADKSPENEVNANGSANDASSSNNNNEAKIKRQMASLSKLNEMISITSSGERHCIDESISSLANDSFINTSQENTPCNIGGHHSLHGGHQAPPGHYIAGKGSDSMLWNQSVYSIDDCSDCCPSSHCHCSCPACSSSNGTALEGGECESGPIANDGALDRGAICIHGHLDGPQSQHQASAEFDDYDGICDSSLIQDDHNNLDEPEMIHCQRRKSADESGAVGASGYEPGDRLKALATKRELRQHQQQADTDTRSNSSSSSNNINKITSSSTTCSSTRRSQTIEMRPIAGSSSGGDLQQTTALIGLQAAAKARNLLMEANHQLADEEQLPEAGGSKAAQKAMQTAAPVAFALQAAANSVLGACTATHQVIAGGNIGQQHYHKFSSNRDKFSEREQQQQLKGELDQANQQQIGAQIPATIQGGPIQTSLEMVKSNSQRRKATKKLKKRVKHDSGKGRHQQRGEGSCFTSSTYHDDYEYNYGLVQTDSDSENYYYHDDDDDEVDDEEEEENEDGANIYDDELNSTSSPRRARPELLGDDVSGEEDDFEHEGRFLSGRLSSGANNDRPHQCRSPGRRRFLTRNRGGSDVGPSGSLSGSGKKQKTTAKELQLDDHRINSVALIAATLRAGGAIVDSGGLGSSLPAERNQQQQQQPSSSSTQPQPHED